MGLRSWLSKKNRERKNLEDKFADTVADALNLNSDQTPDTSSQEEALRKQKEELEKQKLETQQKAEGKAKRATYKFKRRRRSLLGRTSMVSGNELGNSNFKLGRRSILKF